MGESLLEALRAADQRDVLSRARRRRFPANAVVLQDGDAGDTVHFVVQGHFAVRATTALGHRATLRIIGPDEFFGELAVLSPAARSGSVVALDPAETLALHREDFDALRASAPAVEQVLVEALVGEIRRLSEALVDALYLPADQRVWRRLLDLVRLFRVGDETAVTIPVTQEDLAELAGTTRQTVNRLLRGAEADEVLRLARGQIEVVDVGRLAGRSA